MKPIKYTIGCLLALAFLSHIISCGKQGGYASAYTDRVAQDPSYRIGKWYSVSNGAGFNFSTNPLLDTIWFTSDSLAGWSAFGGNPYVFWPTYFSDPNHIIYIAPDPLDTSKRDTVFHECGMIGDTFIIYWPTSNFQVFDEHYLKMKS
jgi:hypothetical protein